MIIEQPCVSCGISLQNGVKIVAISDIFKGCLGVVFSSLIMTVTHSPSSLNTLEEKKSTDLDSTNNRDPTNSHRKDSDIAWWYHDEFYIALVFLIVSCFEILLAFILLYAAFKKNVYILNFWLIATGLQIPINIFLIKIYEMIVVFAYTEDLTCEAGGNALEEFRKLPYMCNIKTQLYPPPVIGSKSDPNNMDMDNQTRRPSTYLTDKSFMMNVETSVFSMIQHNR